VNQQPPMHQLRMRRSSRFGDESKTHPPLTKVFGFFSLCSVGKVFPSYLPPPPTSLLLTFPLLPPSHLPPPPTYLTSFCTHSIIRAWESLKQEGKIRSFKREGRSGNQKRKGKIGSQKWEGGSGNQKREGRNGSQDNVFEAETKRSG